MDEGTWPKNDIRRAFVAGVAWWQYDEYGFSMWTNERRRAEKEAEKRYGSQPVESEEKDNVIQTIADIIVAEAKNLKRDDLVGCIYHIQNRVSLKLMEFMDELRRIERMNRNNSEHK